MGQIVVPSSPSIILTAVDRLIARNADGGIAPAVSHVILFGEQAGLNLSVSNVIALGAFALDAGIAAPELVGSIAIGVNAGSAITGPSANVPVDHNVGMIFIGEDAGQNLVLGDTSVIIGPHALETATGLAGNVISKTVWLGAYAGSESTGTPTDSSVFIGYRVAGSANITALGNSVMIGAGVATNAQGNHAGNVYIGASVANNAPNSGTDNVVIGQSASPTINGTQNVVLGQGAGITSASESVVIGQGCNGSSGARNTLVGNLIQCTGGGNVILGYRALINSGFNINGGANGTNYFIVGNVGAVHLFGNIATGTLMVGTSGPAENVLLQGAGQPTNALALVNGTRGVTVPVNGGFCYSLAGELHWVSAGNIDTPLTTPVAGFTVATLPAGFTGQRTFVTNALAPAFGAAVAGGGAVTIPVFFNGAAWIVG